MNRCTNIECPINSQNQCTFAPTVKTEAGYRKNIDHWKKYAEEVGTGATPEQLRDKQVASVKARTLALIAKYCRPQDMPLRDALKEFDK